MEEDLIIPHDSAKNGGISVIEDGEVKDFVYKHFREVTDGSLFHNVEELSHKEHGSSIKKDKQSLRKGHCKNQQGAFFSGKILSFGCLVCKDDLTYSPNDLLKHFQVAHEGTLPTYPCDLCGFVTNKFPTLQRHRIEHRNTLVTCELCNDDVKYSLLLVTRHYMMCHSQNGHFNCDWCDFTTMDAGTFVQHIHHHNETHWKCPECRHISLNEEDHETHMEAHSGLFPFTCPICGFGAALNEILKKHTAAVHKRYVEKRNSLKNLEDGSTQASPNLKQLLKKSGNSQEAQRITKLNCLSGNLTNQNGRLIKPELSIEETHHNVDRTKKDNNWSKVAHNLEHSLMLQDGDNSAGSDVANHKNPNGLTVLMVKNKISLPPNCTTKVMGFKMVDGKKHLVLKVIPTVKQDSTIQNNPSFEDVAPKPALDNGKSSVENGECTDGKSSPLNTHAVSPRNGSCLQLEEDDIMAVKVKIEEEETSVCNLDTTTQRVDNGAQANYPSSTCADFLTNEDLGDQSHPSQTSGSERSTSDNNLLSATFNSATTSHSFSKINSTGKVTGSSSFSRVTQETVQFTLAHKNTASLPLTDSEADEHSDDQFCHSTPGKINGFRPEFNHKNGQQHFKRLSSNSPLQSESSPTNSASHRESAVGSESCTQCSPSQEVFTFHNYSKETFCSSLNTNHSFGSMSELSADRESTCESSQFSLAESREPISGETPRKNSDDMDNMSESDIEVDECVASVDDPLTEDENFDSVLQDFNIIKVEEDCIPISKKPPETKSSSFGSFVEEHSDTIISQQLNKDRVKTSGACNDALKQTKTTLRILQLPDGKQPVLLRTAENRFAMPVQVKATPGFKLITNSAHPQINVSYMTPSAERSSNQTGVTLSPNSRRLAVSTPKAGTAEKATTLLSAVQPGLGTSSNHYLIQSPSLKGPVLLSSSSHNTPKDKSVKTQPTCYLVQKSVPFVHTPNSNTLRLASTQLPANSRPVLAMPASAADKSSALQSGRQAFLLRYISQPKSGLILNNQDGIQCSQTSESSANKVLIKFVTPSSGAPTSSGQPLFLATRPQTQCFLVASNKTNANFSNGVKKLITIQNTLHKESCISSPQMNVKVQLREAEKPVLAPRPIRPPSQRKRRRKALFDELPETLHKARRFSNRALTDKDTPVLWKPVAKDVERTLRLTPFNSLQQIKCPRRYQPVVVLNHPDADIPEVASIMKVVNRHKGFVTKVSLSQKTVQALAELGAQGKNYSTKGASSHNDDPRPRSVQSSVRERFILKMKLRKKSRRKYEVVEPGCRRVSAAFDCWFCGRLFNNQEDWIGHGQRHLMEATRDWNKLF
ncbi:zinc finger protein 518A [Solea solea]|uniref:zinc finger protein 518A n=1 Tax=Solea solea TaxID=90069 RepID=UPI00272A84DA|nr:zinc finger protein 518A [Solea solea]XP_058477503.1 zinc finger protein 518A [Solea solea]